MLCLKNYQTNVAYFFTYLSVYHSPMEHRPRTTLFHFSLSFDKWWRVSQLCPFSTISFSILHVSLVLRLFLFPSGVHWRAWQVMLTLPFYKVCPIHFHFLISCLIGIWLVNSSLPTVFIYYFVKHVLHAFGMLRKVWKSKFITIKTKLRIFLNSNVNSVLLYGSKTWSLTMANRKKNSNPS